MAIEMKNDFPNLEGRAPRPIGFPPGSALGNKNGFLGSLPPALFHEIAPFLKERRLERGQVLHETGAPIAEICFPLTGAISLHQLLSDGAAILVALVGPTGATGLNAGLGSPVTMNRAVVQLPGTAAFIPARTFASVAARSEELRVLASAYHDVVLAQVQRTAACNIRHSAQQRICRWLLQIVDAGGGDKILMTQEYLAELLGVRRTTVTLAAQALQKKNVIQYRRGSIGTGDYAALRAASCNCYEAIKNLTPLEFDA
jgi:CRP-like cAMP-binding protein